jgi:probable HAF family extracellular repeat protein
MSSPEAHVRKRGRRLAVLLGASVLALAGLLAVERERVADLIHAFRTGYWFEWMPEGVIPGRNGTNVLNDAGVVAVDIIEEWPSHVQAGTWSPREGWSRPLGVLDGSRACFSHGINRHGWIVGTISEPQKPNGRIIRTFQRAFLWTPASGIAELPGLVEGPFLAPADINERGEVVGSATGRFGRVRAFRWEIGSGMRDLGALSDDGESNAVAINDDGWIAGNARSGPSSGSRERGSRRSERFPVPPVR